MKTIDLLKKSLVMLIILFSTTQFIKAQSYGAAYSVDGDITEWNLSTDYFAHMFRAGKTDKPVESYLYLHYDCSTETMYALVLTKDGVPGLKQADDAWITINDISNKVVNGSSGNDGTPPDFAWYDIGYDGNNNHVRGYEASFQKSEGLYDIMAHIQVWDDGESQTSKSDKDWVELDIDCQNGSDCEDCDGKVTALTLEYTGNAAATIVVIQDKDDIELFNGFLQPGEEFTFYGADDKGTMGTKIHMYVDGGYDVEIHTSCSQPIGPGLVKGSFLVITGYSLDNGLLCPVPDCMECDGKVKELTLQYTGTSAATIEVIQDKGSVELFNELVQSGAYFNFDGAESDGNMGTKIYVNIIGGNSVEIHTSCSQPIGPGLIIGDFVVINGYSVDGGLLCPIPDQELDLAVTKEVNDETPVLNDLVSFTISVINLSSTLTATNVEITDVLNPTLIYVSHNTANGTFNQGTGIWNIPSILPSATVTLTLVVQATSMEEACNVATLTDLDQTDTNPNNNTDDACVDPPDPGYDVGVVKSVTNSTPLMGENFDFEVTVTNNSDVAVQNVKVSDLINLSYFNYVGFSTTQGTYNNSTGLWNVGNLDVDQSETLTITVQAILYDERCNVATVIDYDHFNEDSNEPNNSDDACVDPCCHDLDLVINKTVDDPTPDVNDIVKFTVTVTNTSSTITATGIVIEDIISPSYVFQSFVADHGNYDHVSGLWTIPSLFNLATATLDIYVEVLECGDNIAILIALDQEDTNNANNEGFAVACPDGPSGGGNGGIESNGNMANKIASRNYFRMRNNESARFDVKSELVPFRETDVRNGLIVPASNLKSETSNLLDFIPESGPFETEAQIVTPNDLLELSNAQEVFSADYYREDDRLGAILAMTTKSGEVYNHTKLICDRLTGANLDLVRIVNIQDNKFILGKLIQQTGEVDFAISFIAYESNGEYVIDNRWHNEAYNPDEDAEIFNFQVWSVTPEMTLKLVDDIITRLKSEKNIRFRNSDNPKVPEIFVRNGYYKNGSLFLNIYNEAGATELTVSGNMARVENGEREDFSITVPLNPGNEDYQLVEVATGHTFDISFSVANNLTSNRDALYFADGPWGTYAEANGGIIDEFVTQVFSGKISNEEYLIERDASLRGEVKSYVSLFRSLKVGNYPVDLSDFNQIEFNANGSGTLEIVIAKEGIESWSEQFRKVIHLEPEVKNYTINYSDLTSIVPAERFTADDIVSVVFNSIGNGNTYQDFEINISDLKFKKGTTETAITGLNNISVENYPNPFYDQTTIDFSLPASGDVQIVIYDMLGQQVDVIADSYFNEGKNTVSYSANGLTNGTYIYKLFHGDNVVMKRMSVLR